MDIITLPPALLNQCTQAIGRLQRGLAEALGVSDRTVSRYYGGGANVSPAQCHALARAVFPRDPALAAEVAAMGGTTLQALGLGAPPPVLPPAARAPASQGVSTAYLLDAVVCAGADLHGYPTGHVRAILAASFARAMELGLTMEVLAKGFAAKPAVGEGKDG